MGIHQSQSELFYYSVNLDQRVRTDHPLRRVAEAVDFSFVRDEVAHCYGENGNESVDPIILLKMMFLLFFDNVPSERELMAVIRERLDYLWFLGYGLDDDIPNHSVLSKARKRWGKEVFERLFVRSVEQCVAAGRGAGTSDTNSWRNAGEQRTVRRRGRIGGDASICWKAALRMRRTTTGSSERGGDGCGGNKSRTL